MGAGLALQVKRAHPAVFEAYRAACARGEVRIGRMWAAPLPDQRWIVNFPTKDHWRAPSRMAYIDAGLADLVRWIRESGVRSVAVPMLGCGKGGLDWEQVRPRVEDALGGLDVRVELYVG
jgi:O-acetyl-ADP-ribose deacetylase (regulator of RNase III)